MSHDPPRIDVYHHIQQEHDEPGDVREAISALTAAVQTLTQQGAAQMATVQELVNDIQIVKQNTLDYIAKRDAIDVQKDADTAAAVQKMNDAIAAGTVSQQHADELQAGIDAAFAAAEDAKALLDPPHETPTPAVDDAVATGDATEPAPLTEPAAEPTA